MNLSYIIANAANPIFLYFVKKILHRQKLEKFHSEMIRDFSLK